MRIQYSSLLLHLLMLPAATVCPWRRCRPPPHRAPISYEVVRSVYCRLTPARFDGGLVTSTLASMR